MYNYDPKHTGKLGGKKSAKSRFAGKSAEEIREMMQKVRKGAKVTNKPYYKIIKRTFEALNYPEDSLERTTLNENVITSEFLPEDKYVLLTVVAEAMFKTKEEAKKFLD